MAVRPGTGKIFMCKERGDTIKSLNEEIADLTDNDVAQLSTGIADESYNY